MTPIVFKKCNAAGFRNPAAPHGYFHRGSDVLPIKVKSLAAGRHVMATHQEFAGQDTSTLEQQMKDAGLPEFVVSPEQDVLDISKAGKVMIVGDLGGLPAGLLQHPGVLNALLSGRGVVVVDIVGGEEDDLHLFNRRNRRK